MENRIRPKDWLFTLGKTETYKYCVLPWFVSRKRQHSPWVWSVGLSEGLDVGLSFIVLRNNHSNNFQRYYNSVACLQFVVSSAQVTHRTITSIQWVAFEFARVMTVAFRFKWVLCWKHKGWYVPVCSRTGIWMCTRVGTALYSRLCWGKLYTRIVKLINKHVTSILKY